MFVYVHGDICVHIYTCTHINTFIAIFILYLLIYILIYYYFSMWLSWVLIVAHRIFDV